MTHAQKLGRILLFSVTAIMICIISSMLASVGIFAFQRMLHASGSLSKLAVDIGIVFVSMMVNTVCVIVLLAVSKADRKLIPPLETPPEPETDRKD